MNISIKATHLDLTPSIKQYVEEKIGGLGKIIFGPIEAKVELERDRHHQSGLVFRAEVTMFAGGKVLRADALGEDMYAAIDLVMPKLREQITKFKNKRDTLQRRGARLAKKKR
ncbi:MAG: ribosomal subunit interface protein [Candidatus Doudnabacteria bacterium RIFCSPLOWO2_02_FULL_48_8]|uniref:Ribosomal subunit interface protein n=1 Tax=Candidatus Doudnabacteria bacterium RIFCSPHIGHO2_01_FULL_46_24 TaxID=1817825 RepID=A0A1F5NU29_9BACT|nr:MAG: ribosomal subunit interface protein [Candidatus Doudnabacteria bacterium RIFCSPHIGHO2_01_FULL_46_24]OGE95749.1 MAG: ribosomal subunit interface protein [Candidatus Doudnabacteria bacterium RIFCSPLOWO2_02_FULL_48_8]OGE96059.1 MAG: ribosomal subunit interface protein [Candidatus Doudnabacteria bacterium RIFCSPHIGHO2_12_FULL_48_11]